MEKNEAVALVVKNIQAFNKAEALKGENVSEEIVDAYAVIQREQITALVSDLYDAFSNAGLLK